MKARITFLFIAFLGLWCLLGLRAAYLQILPNTRLQQLQARQFQTSITLQSRRGAVVDRKGRELAISTTAYSVFADPKLIERRRQTAKKLATVLGQSTESIYSKIKDPKKRFVWIERLIDKPKADQIKSWEEKGLQIVEEYKRVYPNESLLAQVLGFVGNEGQGLEGIELGHNDALQGNKKKISVRRDARGRPLVADGMIFAENPDGAEVKLTVDSETQHILEDQLTQAVSEFDADQAMGVILDAKTSAILAMASAPTFDANKAAKATPALRKNRIVTDIFEPGSTMKTFVVAAALREKILAPNTKYNTENGSFRIGNRVISEAESHERWAQLTVSEILAYSSNIGTAKIAFDLGPENLKKALGDFGFGVKTGVDLPGDVRGLMLPLPWHQHLLANISFGQGIGVTALQLANAYAAIANGGTLNTPYIIQSVRDPETGHVTETSPKPVRRVLTPDESASLRMMLTGVTAEGGTGVNARVDGFLVAGKTGTAQKSGGAAGYIKGAYLSSFAGFLPANDPKYVIFIAVDHPKKKSYYGAAVAAPVFSRVASYLVRQEGLAPVLISAKNLVEPGVKSKSRTIAGKEKKKEVIEKVVEPISAEPLQTLPDLTHLSLREALVKLRGAPLQVRVRGEGRVAEMEPAAGAPVPADNKVTLILK